MVSRLKPQFNKHCIRIWSILKTALLATAATAASSLPRAVPLMHTQGNFNRFLIKVTPEGSSRGFQIPYIQNLINMEPCTLWGKFLVREREEYSFSGPQARACREQQPGALSSKWALQPLLTTGLEEKAAFQSGIQIPSASWPPFDEVAFTEDMFFSGLVGAGENPTQEAEAGLYTDPARNIQEIAAFDGTVEDECGSPPTLPWRHQRCSGHQHHVLDQVAGQHAVNETVARSQLGEHHWSYRCS